MLRPAARWEASCPMGSEAKMRTRTGRRRGRRGEGAPATAYFERGEGRIGLEESGDGGGGREIGAESRSDTVALCQIGPLSGLLLRPWLLDCGRRALELRG